MHPCVAWRVAIAFGIFRATASPPLRRPKVMARDGPPGQLRFRWLYECTVWHLSHQSGSWTIVTLPKRGISFTTELSIDALVPSVARRSFRKPRAAAFGGSFRPSSSASATWGTVKEVRIGAQMRLLRQCHTGHLLIFDSADARSIHVKLSRSACPAGALPPFASYTRHFAASKINGNMCRQHLPIARSP